MGSTGLLDMSIFPQFVDRFGVYVDVADRRVIHVRDRKMAVWTALNPFLISRLQERAPGPAWPDGAPAPHYVRVAGVSIPGRYFALTAA